MAQTERLKAVHYFSDSSSEKNFKHYCDAIRNLEDHVFPCSKGFWQLWLKFTLSKDSLYPYNPNPLQLAVPLIFGIDGQYIQVSIKTDTLGEELFKFSENSLNELEELSDFIFKAMHQKIRDQISWDLQEQGKTQLIKL